LNGATGGFGASYIFMAGSVLPSGIITMLAVKNRSVIQKQQLSKAVV